MRRLACDKKGEILTETIIFVILNIVFLSIMLLFLFSKMSNASLMEEQYAKQIALLIDDARPGTLIMLKMEPAFKEAEKNGINPSDVVSFSENIVSVNIAGKNGYQYSFFNNIQSAKPEVSGNYLVIITEKEEVKNG